MKNNEKTKTTYTKDMLVKKIAGETQLGLRTVKEVYSALEENIFEILSSTNQDTDVSIRLFEGIVIDGTFIPEKTKVNNLTGETILTSSKIKPKANITRNYCEKLTSCI